MIRIGRYEFAVPAWLWVALPFACVAWSLWDYHSSPYSYSTYDDPSRTYLGLVQKFAIASLSAFFVVDIARRARTPWYGLPLLYLVSAAGAVVLIAVAIAGSLDEVTRTVFGVAMMIAAGPRGGGGGVLLLAMVTIGVPIVLAIAAAFVVTLAERILAGLPLTFGGTSREFFTNLLPAFVWLGAGIGGYLAIRSGYNIAVGASYATVPRWLPVGAAVATALAATALHLYFADRNRRRDGGIAAGHLRLWLILPLCLAALFYRPEVCGLTGIRFYYDQVRPAMRAMHLIPTPPIEIAGYKLDVPYHDQRVSKGKVEDGKGVSYIGVPLPAEYGLTTDKHRPSVTIYLRDAPANLVA